MYKIQLGNEKTSFALGFQYVPRDPVGVYAETLFDYFIIERNIIFTIDKYIRYFFRIDFVLL